MSSDHKLNITDMALQYPHPVLRLPDTYFVDYACPSVLPLRLLITDIAENDKQYQIKVVL